MISLIVISLSAISLTVIYLLIIIYFLINSTWCRRPTAFCIMYCLLINQKNILTIVWLTYGDFYEIVDFNYFVIFSLHCIVLFCDNFMLFYHFFYCIFFSFFLSDFYSLFLFYYFFFLFFISQALPIFLQQASAANMKFKEIQGTIKYSLRFHTSSTIWENCKGWCSRFLRKINFLFYLFAFFIFFL